MFKSLNADPPCSTTARAIVADFGEAVKRRHHDDFEVRSLHPILNLFLMRS